MEEREWKAKLETYLDGELPSAEASAMDAHLRQCNSCGADLANHLQLKRSLQAAGKRYAPSAEFRARVRRKITAPRSRFAGWLWPALAGVMALLAVATLLVGYTQRERALQQHFFSEIADLHVATLASTAPVDVVSTDRHTVKPWFQGKIPFTFNLPELQGSGFDLLGGRLAYLGQMAGAELLFQVRKHQISVFIFPENTVASGLGTDAAAEKRLTFSVETWRQDSLRYIVIGDASPADISKLSDLLKAAQ